MSQRQSTNERICQYSVSGSNLNVHKIINDLSQCGLHRDQVQIIPQENSVLVKIRNPTKEQAEKFREILDCKVDFPLWDFKKEFANFRRNFDFD